MGKQNKTPNQPAASYSGRPPMRGGIYGAARPSQAQLTGMSNATVAPPFTAGRGGPISGQPTIAPPMQSGPPQLANWGQIPVSTVGFNAGSGAGVNPRTAPFQSPSMSQYTPPVMQTNMPRSTVQPVGTYQQAQNPFALSTALRRR